MEPYATHKIVQVFDTPEQLALAAAERFVECAAEVTGTATPFSVALAGGKTPERVYELLASERFKSRVEWSQVHLFFGDERCVPQDHPDSNFAMVYETLISKVTIPAQNVRRIIGEGDANENAKAYENQLRTFFATRAWPRFDLVLLGMGADGHTASLFPNTQSLEETERWVVATQNPLSDQKRITLTLPAINHAARIMFLITGNEKANRLAEILRGQSEPAQLPARLIQPVVDSPNGTAGELEWLVDRDAASLL